MGPVLGFYYDLCKVVPDEELSRLLVTKLNLISCEYSKAREVYDRAKTSWGNTLRALASLQEQLRRQLMWAEIEKEKRKKAIPVKLTEMIFSQKTVEIRRLVTQYVDIHESPDFNRLLTNFLKLLNHHEMIKRCIGAADEALENAKIWISLRTLEIWEPEIVSAELFAEPLSSFPWPALPPKLEEVEKGTISKCFHTLSLVHHPDRTGNSVKMQEINAAKEFLMEKKK